MSVSTLLIPVIMAAISCGCHHQEENEYNNMYWPGDFEQGLYGGNFSKANNVIIDQSDNATPGGSFAWFLKPQSYQHLELLTEGTGDFTVQFMGKAEGELNVVVKVVYRSDLDSVLTQNHTVKLPEDSTWQTFTVNYTLLHPYPGPQTGEVLITCYNPGVKAWIDDVVIKRAGPDLSASPEKNYTRAFMLAGGDFEAAYDSWNQDISIALTRKDDGKRKNHVVRLGSDSSSLPAISQKILPKAYAGKDIRVSADVGFETVDEEGAYSWAGIVIGLREGASENAPALVSDPKPFWCPLGLAPAPGTLRRIHATYHIPEDADTLLLIIEHQKRAGSNIANIDNITIEEVL